MIYIMNERNERKAAWLIILFTVILATSAIGSVSGQYRLFQQQERLLNALIKVESNGNDKAIGDNGKAIGCLQIHKIYWTDAVERSGLGGSYVDCMRRDYSKSVVRAYMKRYGGMAWSTFDGFNPEKIARIHNGGPRGYYKLTTKAYWKKVEKVLAK